MHAANNITLTCPTNQRIRFCYVAAEKVPHKNQQSSLRPVNKYNTVKKLETSLAFISMGSCIVQMDSETKDSSATNYKDPNKILHSCLKMIPLFKLR